ncbi:hypothetical protein ACJ73_07943 [Blastomyces percursus]|uniref:tRNA(Phe) 7-[(3-amino-3-carboxypropyl)-4-demethylwyosine(37)-N(4)]-methyltransferase n=1 Tax=Blastomyces percursus TaxID=1658174 RepID=A0A1J9PWI6_9EURO|nr:hypothetical protein ACJ73_07943 [Blastomyces percursus]
MDYPGPGFEAKKQKILRDLSAPDEEYTDLSPKGSVDAGIRDLIHSINQIPGLVTTSSCAGRISVFLEGGGSGREKTRVEDNENGSKENYRTTIEAEVGIGESSAQKAPQFAPTGGKGSGKWLFVSHEPVEIDLSCEGSYLHGIFHLLPGNEKIGITNHSGSLRLVRFHFEPMILHIMASSLKHAQPVLAAATTAGFRESGIQSLRCLGETEAYPIVAVRSSGLALESIIGFHQRSIGNESEEDIVRSLVSEDYLRMLLAAANERFKTNAERRERFWTKLQEFCQGHPGNISSRRPDWENPEARRERKRAEGLRRSKAAMEAKAAQSGLDTYADIMGEEGEPSFLYP